MASFHQSYVIHKDIKLENIMVENDAFGQVIVKIGDFGSAYFSAQDK